MADHLINHSNGFDITAPGANTSILASNITPKRAGSLAVTVSLTTASVFNVLATDGTTTHLWGLNSSTALNAADVYRFVIDAVPALSYNFQGETDGVIETLIVNEVMGGIAGSAQSAGGGTTGGTVTADTMVFDSDADNTAQVISSAAGTLVHLHVINPNTAKAFVQLFDVAAGSVTVGTTTPNQVYVIPANDGTNDGAIDLNPQVAFGTAITYAATTTATGNGDPTTGLILSAAYV